jgi:hypothetical protein
MIWTWWLVSVWKKARPDDSVLHRMIRTWGIWVCFCLFCHKPGWSEVTPDDPGTTRKHTTATFGGWSIYTPSPLHLLLSHSPTNHASKALNSSLLSILELDSCKETPRDWEEVRFEVWFESTPWACTCSSQEALEATGSLIRICYSWSLASRRLGAGELPFLCGCAPKVCITPSFVDIYLWATQSSCVVDWVRERVIGQPYSLWAPQRRRSYFVEWISG